jgi:LDH2 family malate/lactate/ureidoglycolate dehydrogenase
MTEVRVPAAELRSTVTQLFEAVGMDAADAATMGDAIAYTDLRGIYSHGVAKVAGYLDWLTERGVDPKGKPVVVSRKGAAATVDARNALGHIACVFAMRQAVEIARENSVGVVAVANSNHCGALAYYPEIAVAAGMVGIAVTNALPTMAPWGGLDRIVGINPVALGFPGRDQVPVLLDTSFGVVARGKIVVHFENGIPLPEGWAFDKFGEPTTDPAAAMEGLNQPIGGPKGVGLGIAFGMLGALLAGASYGSRLGSLDTGPASGRDGQLIMAINVEAFRPIADFLADADDIVREIHESRRKPGVDRLYVPGEPERESMRRLEHDGIPVDPATRKELAPWAARLGVCSAWLE